MKKLLLIILTISITAFPFTQSFAATGCPKGSFEIGKSVRTENGQRITTRQCMRVNYSENMEAELRPIIERDLTSIPDEAFKRWINGNVVFKRTSRGMHDSPLAADRGVITIYDPYSIKEVAERLDLLVFELAKVLWYGKINSGEREAQTPQTRKFDALNRRHERTINAMKFGSLTDNDPQSMFAYACRVAVLKKTPQEYPPPGYSDEEWGDVQNDWVSTRDEMQSFLGELFNSN